MELEQVRTVSPSQKDLESYFVDFENRANEWMSKARSIKVTNEQQTEMMAEAKKARLALRDIRIAVDKKHKELKEEALRTGQMLDSIRRRLVTLIEPIEAVLKEQEDFAATQERNRKAALKKERSEKLSAYMPLHDAMVIPLEDMTEPAFNTMIESYRLAKAAKEEQERKEFEEIKKEEERTRKEYEKLRKENERIKAERDAQREILEAQERKKAQEAAAKRKAARAPDVEKLKMLANQIGEMSFPKMSSPEGEKVVDNVKTLMAKVVVYLFKEIASL